MSSMRSLRLALFALVAVCTAAPAADQAHKGVPASAKNVTTFGKSGPFAKLDPFLLRAYKNWQDRPSPGKTSTTTTATSTNNTQADTLSFVRETVTVDAVAAGEVAALQQSLEAVSEEEVVCYGHVCSAQVAVERVPDLAPMTELKSASLAMASTVVDRPVTTDDNNTSTSTSTTTASSSNPKPASKLDATLRSIYQQHVSNGTNTGASSLSTILPEAAMLSNDTVTVDAVAAERDNATALKTDLEALTGQEVSCYQHMCSARVPVGAIMELEDMESLAFARAAMATTHPNPNQPVGVGGIGRDLYTSAAASPEADAAAAAEKPESKLDGTLQRLASDWKGDREGEGEGATVLGATVRDGHVTIDAVAASEAEAADLKTSLEGLTSHSVVCVSKICSTNIPLSALAGLEEVESLEYARPSKMVLRGSSQDIMGARGSQGMQGAMAARAAARMKSHNSLRAP
ncbi:unnamed protein product [Vitrella brassicaformis CCMP3155]|uniref:Uncharacterized protein n=1 Tax=Vitrella brassicaformis (strain CCMP3155) TaxID=1169540 RepID=A0A0G4FLA9_VITBC|nr:unnamed protein product [Vitrella brassicaformis CCMP3155]|eukprot:CEM14786.1 unnamed protein product [Vitrella brassicaformis CCMP3155]